MARQFDEAIALTAIIEREIARTGAFKDKLGDYSFAFARSERFDAPKAETILRDLFKERTGHTMNQMRETYADRLEKLTDDQRASAYQYASEIGDMMEGGVKLSFNRAVAHQSQQLASNLGITDAAARSLMAEEFEAAENQTLWDWGKELDEQFYRPQIEAEKAEREQSRSQGRSSQDGGRSRAGSGNNGNRSRSRSRSSGPTRRGP